MALTDKNIVITPNVGQAADPKIVFSGADSVLGPQNITLQAYPTSNGTLSFEGSAGQLFSITNSLSGSIFSVNDVSGIPSIEVLDTGTVIIAQYSGNVGIGIASPAVKLHVVGGGWINNSSGDSATRALGFTVATAPPTNITIGSDPGDTARVTSVIVKGIGRASIISLRNVDVAGCHWDLIADANTSNGFYIQRAGQQPGLTINSTNNVGIGINSPAARLHVAAAATTNVSLTWNAAAGQILRNENSELAIGLEDSAPFALYIQGRQNTNAARDIVINPLGGNIGIGTVSPTVSLDVTGSIRASQSVTIGTGGTYEAGSLFSDANWGMIFRAKQVSPAIAQFMWTNSAGTELFRFNGSALTTSVTGNAATATTATNQSGGTVSATSIATTGSITASGGNNYSYTLHHGNYERLVLPAANNGAANGEAGLYLWISEPAVTWTAAGIGRNRRNSNTGFPRINTALSGNMIRFLENDGLEFSGITSGGVAYTHANMSASNLLVYGDVTAYASDKRLKTNSKVIENSLEKVLALTGVYFDWVDNIEELGFHPKRKHNDAGLFAQDVQQVLPQAIEPAPFDQELDPETQTYKSKSGEDYLTVNYSKIVPLLVNAIKEQQAKIDKLESLLMQVINGKQ